MTEVSRPGPGVQGAPASPAAPEGWLLRHERLVFAGGALLAFLLVWEAAFRFAWVNPVFISSPVQVALAAVKVLSSPEMRADLAVSGTEFLVGYLMAIVVGIPLGLAVGWSKRLYYALSPFIHTFNTIPRITLLPIIIIWFGIGIWSKIIVVFLGAVIPGFPRQDPFSPDFWPWFWAHYQPVLAPGIEAFVRPPREMA